MPTWYTNSIFCRGAMRWLFPVAVVATIAVLCFTPAMEGADFWAYFQAYGAWHHAGTVTDRTPLYPVLVGVFYWHGYAGKGFIYTAIVQGLVFLWSLPLFYQSLLLLTKKMRWVATVGAVVYAFYPLTLGYVKHLNTAALSIYLTVAFAYYGLCVLAGAYGQRGWKVYAFGAMLLLLNALRPASAVLYVPFVAVLVVLVRRKARPQVWRCTAALAVNVIYLLWWCSLVYQAFGVFSPSPVGTYNQYYLLRHHPGWNTAAVSDSAIREDFDRYLWRPVTFNEADWCDSEMDLVEAPALINDYGIGRLHKAIKELYASNPDVYCSLIGERFSCQVLREHGHCNDNWTNVPAAWWPQTMATHLAIALVALALLPLAASRGRRVAVVFLLLISLPTMAMAVVGASNDWARLTCSLVPIDWLLLAWCISVLWPKKHIATHEELV